MFRSLTGEGHGHVSGGQSSSSPVAGHGVASAGLVSQESSWIGLLSVVSRPALSFLQKYLPGRTRHPVLAEPAVRWLSGESQPSFVEEDPDFLNQLDAMMPPHAAPQLRRERGGAAVPWLTADALRDMGMESGEDLMSPQAQDGFVSSARTLLSQVLVSSVSQEVRPWATVRGSESRTWWGTLWGGEVDSQQGLTSHVSWSEDGLLCPQQLGTETKDRSSVFVQSEEWSLRENTGHSDHNGPDKVQNVDGSTCSQVPPELDNGYSSLEEGHVLMSRLLTLQEAEPTCDGAAARTDMASEGGASSSTNTDEEEQEGQSAEVMAGSAPQCQNKAIAFIMGCPCSDDEDSSQSEDSDSSNDDDDGFDSEGSSDLSDSSCDDDDDDDVEASDSDEEAESEADRLWNSLCKSLDPYNPQNFTAALHSGRTPPMTVPSTTHPTPPQPSPASSPDLAYPAGSSAAAPPPLTSALDSWDDSTSASEVDEAETLRLLSSFSSSDPYSPLHFQAPVRTQGSGRAAAPRCRATRATRAPQTVPDQSREATPEHRKEGEERLDSGFSDLPRRSRTSSGAKIKKVRFCDHVEEFFASCGEEEETEDRRGPWEELARDRCRFLRRCQEVEQSISYCLQPQHRLLVVQHRHVLYGQDQ